jgi:hypothetical protein
MEWAKIHRFNGAAAGWPRKGIEGPFRGDYTFEVSFNGAAAGWPRKGRCAKTSRACMERIRLQWGRGWLAAEGSRLAASADTIGVARFASMGPRLVGRGRLN